MNGIMGVAGRGDQRPPVGFPEVTSWPPLPYRPHGHRLVSYECVWARALGTVCSVAAGGRGNEPVPLAARSRICAWLGHHTLQTLILQSQSPLPPFRRISAEPMVVSISVREDLNVCAQCDWQPSE